MKAPPEDFSRHNWCSDHNVVAERWKDSRSAKCKAGHDPKTNSTFMPYGTSSKFTNIYRSPRLAGSLPLSCGNSRRESVIYGYRDVRVWQASSPQYKDDPNRNPPSRISQCECVPWLQYLHKSLNSAFCYVQIGSAQMGALVHWSGRIYQKK